MTVIEAQPGPQEAGRASPAESASEGGPVDNTAGREHGDVNGVDDCGRVGKAADAGGAACQRAALGCNQPVAKVVLQPRRIRLRRGMRPHLAVHRRRDDDRRRGGETGRRDDVTCEAVGHGADPLCGCGRDQDRIRGIGGHDVTDSAVGEQVEQIGIDGVSGERAQRQWRDEARGCWGEEGLDIGTRAFLPHLPRALGNLRVADLGCGNGVLGIVYALSNPQAELTLVDESYMAVQSARENWRAIHGERPADIRAGDGLAEQPAASLDLVLCNPPFHQQQVVGDFLAWRMFTQARAALAKGGELWIVGNRHLGYHHKLKRLFGKVEQVASTPKFVILRAIKG